MCFFLVWFLPPLLSPYRYCIVKMTSPPSAMLTLRKEALQVDSTQPIIKDVVDAPPLGSSENIVPRRSLRRRRGRVGVSLQPTFSLKLTEDEIDEDIYSLTGALPRHHPRRRPVPIQKMLNVSTPPSHLHPPPPLASWPIPSRQIVLVEKSAKVLVFGGVACVVSQ